MRRYWVMVSRKMNMQVPAYASGLDGVQAREKSGVDCELKKTIVMPPMLID